MENTPLPNQPQSKSKPFYSLPKDQFVPEEHLGELFFQVQSQAIFPDYRTFCDCVPLHLPDQILQAYHQQKSLPNFDLKTFVLQNFQLPPEPAKDFKSNPDLSIKEHIEKLWPLLTRQPEFERSSLLPLPYPYIVPGGRFREIYYWDSYFTMLGLQQSGHVSLIQSMIDNFVYFIDTVGYIPNGNRTYYISRSQPPYFSLMLDLLAEEKGDKILKTYAPALRKEYAFWMNGADTLTESNCAFRRVVRMPDGTILNRYWDDKAEPREYAHEKDIKMAKECGRNPEELYRDWRAICESGWDFSSRWLADEKTFHTARATELIPVDLNCLVYFMEQTLVKMAGLEENKEEEDFYTQKMETRKKGILKYCWSEDDSYFYDYDFVNHRRTNIPTLAATYPLYFRLAEVSQAAAVASKLETSFLKPGGLVTTLNYTGEQWDAPNGWAPLQWMSIKGLRNYGFTDLANKAASNWINLNIETYKRTGKLMEKYNVENTSLEGGGGCYLNQDGFGWTNGVLLKLLSEYGDKL